MLSTTREVTAVALLTAVGVAMFVVESFIPTPLPFLKIGLANISSLVAMMAMGVPQMFMVVIIRVVVDQCLLGRLGPLSAGDAAKRNSRRQLDGELAKYSWLKPVALEIFAGKYEPSKPGLSFFERFLPARDYRNWNAIRAWANELSAKLLQSEVFQIA